MSLGVYQGPTTSILQASESGASWDCNVLEGFTTRKKG
jgi:hypothetical protein